MGHEAQAIAQIANRQEVDNYEAIEYLIRHIEGEKDVCSVFGCGRHLSAQEQLFGNKCINHQGNPARLIREEKG